MARHPEVFPVSATRDSDGNLVAVSSEKIVQAFQFNGIVYATQAEAIKDMNISNAKIAVEDARSNLAYAVYQILLEANPTYGEWEDQERAMEKLRDNADIIADKLLPRYGKRSNKAEQFFHTMARAQLAWRHLLKLSK